VPAVRGHVFPNTGLTGEVEGTQTYLHRLVDVLAFRVLPDAQVSPSGYVDLDVEAELTPA
jgi:lipopolysaccharide transport system ATP-binding protein